MHSFSFAKDIGDYVNFVALDGFYELSTATHSTNASDYFDRLSGYTPQSCVVCAVLDYNVPTSETVTLAVNLQDASSTTGSGLADIGSATQSVVSTATAGTKTLTYDVNLTTGKRYVRSQAALTFSGSSTTAASNAVVTVGLAFGGFEQLPST